MQENAAESPIDKTINRQEKHHKEQEHFQQGGRAKILQGQDQAPWVKRGSDPLDALPLASQSWE